jgi:hypothetical protein
MRKSIVYVPVTLQTTHEQHFLSLSRLRQRLGKSSRGHVMKVDKEIPEVLR